MPNKIVIIVEDGMVQEVYLPTGIRYDIVVVDHDDKSDNTPWIFTLEHREVSLLDPGIGKRIEEEVE
jgi:hypothetical protein